MNRITGENPAVSSINAATEQARLLPDWAFRAGSIATVTALPLTASIIAQEYDAHIIHESIVTPAYTDGSTPSSPTTEAYNANRLSVWDAFEPRVSTVLLSGSVKMGLSAIDEQPMVNDSPDDFFNGEVPEGDPGAEGDRANGDGYGDDSNGIYIEPVDARPTGDYGASADLNRLYTCSKPEAYDSPEIAKRLASFCIKYGQRGPDGKGMDVAFINFSNRSNSSITKIMNGFEKTLKKVTSGQFKADAQKVAPTAEAKAAYDEMTIQDGGNRCLPTSSGFAMANKMRTVMDKNLSKYSQVVVLTSLRPCASSTLPGSVFGVANFNAVDIIDIDEQSNAVASNTVVHEVAHNLGVDHYGVHVPEDAKFTKGKHSNFIIPARYTSDGTLDITTYLGESKLQPYDYRKKNVMGYAVSGKISLTNFQKHWLGWPNRLMGDNKTAKLVSTLGTEGVHTKVKKSNKPVMVKLAEPYKTGQLDHSESIVYDGMSLTAMKSTKRINGEKRTVIGVDIEFINSGDARSVTSGRWNLAEGTSYIKVSEKQIIQLDVANDGSLSMREISKTAGK